MECKFFKTSSLDFRVETTKKNSTMVYQEIVDVDIMLESAELHDSLQYFGCVCSHQATLIQERDRVNCKNCGRSFIFDEGGILHLLDNDQLDNGAQRELKEHTYDWDSGELTKWDQTERENLGKNYYTLDRQHGLKKLAAYLSPYRDECICFLGVGTGREIEYLLQYIPLGKVICSDISATNLEVIKPRLKGYPVSVECIFTSDLNRCPVMCHEVPIVIINALHHTGDMHEALRKFLDYGYENIFIIEPADNWLIQFFEHFGLARRVEYSGVKPGRLDISRLQSMCTGYSYKLKLKTIWSFPQDYFMRLGIKSLMVTRVFIGLVKIFSMVTAPFKFGNSVVAHIQRNSPA